MKEIEFMALPEKERKSRVLDGVFYWASVHKPNTSAVKKFNALPAFQISVGLDEEGVAKAKSFGLTVKDPDQYIPMPYVKIQRKVRPPKTEADVKPTVVDSKQNIIPDTILIGNGSIGRVKFGTRWSKAPGGGVIADLYKVQVIKLNEYTNSSDSSLLIEEGGFTVPEMNTDNNVPFDEFDE